MNWKPEMDELKRREEFAERLGGAERVKRQHDGGRYTIRERIDRLVDPGSFHEIGKIAGKASYDANNDLKELTPSNFVFGRARLDGRPVGGEDPHLVRDAKVREHLPRVLDLRQVGGGAQHEADHRISLSAISS